MSPDRWMIGKSLGRFKITARLGVGGMGEVWRASDERLGRDVAVKILPQAVASDPEQLIRFEAEARALAALSHPNILAIHDFGRDGEIVYAVTELLEGETLRERLERERMPWRKAEEIAAAVADGLAAAHARGIIHRDIKPENLFLTKDGHVKILDFGLAKEMRPMHEADTAAFSVPGTLAGSVVGTIGYMAPEQVRGEATDGRTDIFGLGCVLFEMLTGNRAFGRTSAVDALAAVLTAPAPEPSGSAPEVPAELDRLVARCLAKSPLERFQTASDLAFALRSLKSGVSAAGPAASPGLRKSHALLGAGALLLLMVAAGWWIVRAVRGAPAPPSASPVPAAAAAERKAMIVVLPFLNLGPAEDGYFADGITEEITSRLAMVRTLGVISRTTAMQYKATAKTVKQIGAELGVEYVLEGSVQWDRSGGSKGRVRITPQLVRVADDTHVWAQPYDRVLEDLFSVQSEVASSVAGALDLTLGAGERGGLQRVPTRDMEAYDHYLRGLEAERQGSERKSVEAYLAHYQAAVDRDPSFVEARARLARAHAYLYWMHYDRSQARREAARAEAERAAALGPDVAEARWALGVYAYTVLLDYDRALGELEAARRLQPGNPVILGYLGYVHRRRGDLEEALRYQLETLTLDPKNVDIHQNLMETFLLLRRYDDADREAAAVQSLAPGYGAAYARRAMIRILRSGDTAAALPFLREGWARPDLTDEQAHLAYASFLAPAMAGDYNAAAAFMERDARPVIANQFYYLPKPLIKGRLLWWQGRKEEARRSFGEARAILEQAIKDDPGDARFHGPLGVALAGLGMKEEAMRSARRGVELLPITREAWRGLYRVEELAEVAVMAGDYDTALAQLEILLSHASEVSAPMMNLDPRWAPLRSDPRFQSLLAKYGSRP